MKKKSGEEKYMKLALQLAKKGWGSVGPNPMVGAVLVKKGSIIGKGYHKKFGGLHAEIEAINAVKGSPDGATLYVTLEPCSTFGKTPPCTEKIIKSRISRVVIALKDPNPLHNGEGIRLLKKAHITVDVGLCSDDAEKLNASFFHYMRKKTPFVTLKTAMSLDGKIATKTGSSKWITGEESRRYVHRLRNSVDAIIVGAKTVINDNPQLTVRLKKVPLCSLRIVLDTHGTVPLHSKVLTDEFRKSTLVVISDKTFCEKLKKIESSGARTLTVNEKNGRLDLQHLMMKLGDMGVASVMVESGGELAASFFDEKLVNRICYFYAPKIIGGINASTGVDGKGISDINDVKRIYIEKRKKLGDDLLIEGTVIN